MGIGIVAPHEILQIPIVPAEPIKKEIDFIFGWSHYLASAPLLRGQGIDSLRRMSGQLSKQYAMAIPSESPSELLVDANEAIRFLITFVPTEPEYKLRDDIFEARLDDAIAHAKEEETPIRDSVIKLGRLLYTRMRNRLPGLDTPSLGFLDQGSLVIEWDFEDNTSVVIDVHDSETTPVTFSLIDPSGVSQMGKFTSIDEPAFSRGIEQLSGWLNTYVRRE